MPQQLLLRPPCFPQAERVAPPSAHVSRVREIERLRTPQTDDEEPAAALWNRVVGSQQDLFGDGEVERLELLQDRLSNVAVLPVNEAGHVLDQEGAWPQTGDD